MSGGPKTIQAKDISDVDFLRIVDRLSRDGSWGASWGAAPRWVLRMEVQDEMPDVPWKVLLAKARSLIKRRLMTGCGCGCRGDYEITEAGRALIETSA